MPLDRSRLALSTPEALPLLNAADPAFLLPTALPAGPCARRTGGACCQSCASHAEAHEDEHGEEGRPAEGSADSSA